jgi:hypothetical protein
VRSRDRRRRRWTKSPGEELEEQATPTESKQRIGKRQGGGGAWKKGACPEAETESLGRVQRRSWRVRAALRGGA